MAAFGCIAASERIAVERIMLKLAAIAYPSVAAVMFGLLAVLVVSLSDTASEFRVGASMYYGAAALSLVLAAPIAWLVARRMLIWRERRLLNAYAGVGRQVRSMG